MRRLASDPRSVTGLIVAVALLVGCGGAADGGGTSAPTPAVPVGSAAVDLAPIPMSLVVPDALAARLEVGEMEDTTYLQEALDAGAIAVVEVTFRTDAGERIHFMNAYWFGEHEFDAAQIVDAPPPYGTAVVRHGGFVLGVWGPLDMPFDPASADGVAWVELDGLIDRSASYLDAA